MASTKYTFRSETLSKRKISEILAAEKAGEDQIHEIYLPAPPTTNPIKRRRTFKRETLAGTRFGSGLFKFIDASTQTEDDVSFYCSFSHFFCNLTNFMSILLISLDGQKCRCIAYR